MFSRVLQGASVPGLTVLPAGLLGGFSHVAEKVTGDTSTEDLAECSTVCFSLHQIRTHKHSAHAGTQTVKQEGHPAHPVLSWENIPLSLSPQAAALRPSAPDALLGGTTERFSPRSAG